ncbi:DUF2309 domain-containing protein [Rhabdothermincola salaria]|uniref:DUF2309 domain-containing protein n=1 Tax=Rhabdothermincola salaria TaxID=2903142 RepID=UPI001E50EAF8|nr:DUF2309 domain-containing protein [Rhabdothermincola salaria]MCD9624337.1 DUF2309 domain-containing protein [Rhabdothermincola salaria]
MSPAALAPPAPPVSDAVRARLRADISLAARVLPVSRPLADLVAVNPLGGFEDRDVPTAIEAARAWYGIVGHLGEPAYRAAYAAGRIDDTDLAVALRRWAPEIPWGTWLVPPETGPGHGSTLETVVLADLHHGEVVEVGGRTEASLAEAHDLRGGSEVAATVDAHVVRWCAAHLDRGQAAWSPIRGEPGLYRAWQQLVRHDRTLPRPVRRRLAAGPSRAEDAVLAAFEALDVAPSDQLSVLRAELTALPGWAAHLRWRSEAAGDAALVDYLALRLSLTAALVGDAGPPTPMTAVAEAARLERTPQDPVTRARHALHRLGVDPGALDPDGWELLVGALTHLSAPRRPWVWQTAYEAHYRDELLRSLTLANVAPPAVDVRPRAQVVCCIDVRSEGLRRHLEDDPQIDTLGFAGFFAVAIGWRAVSGGQPLANCPALIDPRHEVSEVVVGSHRVAEANRRRTAAWAGAADGVHEAATTPGSAFALAEAAGWITGPIAGLRTASPTGWEALRRGTRRSLAPTPPTAVDLVGGIPPADRVLTARAALTMMGLTSGFARLVVLCGHSSDTAANPYEASLRCGACGGHGGGPNARVLAAVLNDADTRQALRLHGIDLPDDTVVIAAEHDTTSDVVTVLDPHLVPSTHHDDVERVRRDLVRAGAALAAERCSQLPGAPDAGDGTTTEASRSVAARHVARRGADWSETFPEWGLAGNAAFVIGPRSLTRGLDLQRRVFLHSYDSRVDTDGTALETILTAPLVVAQWINCQYWLSSTDPEVFGAGTKTVHNPVGDVGVLSGRSGDLRLGLPLQSVAAGSRLVHEPLRLMAVVEAPLERIAGIVDRHPGLRDLLGGGWVTLVGRGGPGDPWHEWTPAGWRDWVAPTMVGEP